MDIYFAGGIWEIRKVWSHFGRERDIDLYLAGNGSVVETSVKHALNTHREREEMDVYLAGTEDRVRMMDEEHRKSNLKSLFNDTNILQSFFFTNRFTEEIVIPNAGKFLLDSGAFTFLNQGKKVEWEKYVREYADFINRNKVRHFFELDIDPVIGYDNVLGLRRDLERMTDAQCIPVWHKSRGKEEFVRMCRDYDYVAIGGIVSKEIQPAEYKYFPWFIDTAHKHGARIHGLGFTSLKDLPKYHFDSVDSTAWLSGNRFGTIYQFTGNTLKPHKQPEGTRLADHKKVAIHNFCEWYKFSVYARTNL